MHYFKHFLATNSAHFPLLLSILVNMGALGISMQFALVADVIQLSTLSIRVFQQLFAVAHRVQVSLLVTLWHLFTGRKINILRKRVDTGHFSQSQMVVGTIYFAIVFFLLPTFVVYYGALTAAQFVIIAIVSCLLLSIKVVDSFPIFHLILIYKYPLSLIRGLSFSVDSSNVVKSMRRTRIPAGSPVASSATTPSQAVISSGPPSKRRGQSIDLRGDVSRKLSEPKASDRIASLPASLDAAVPLRPGILKGTSSRRSDTIASAVPARAKLLKFAEEPSGYKSTSGDDDSSRPLELAPPFPYLPPGDDATGQHHTVDNDEWNSAVHAESEIQFNQVDYNDQSMVADDEDTSANRSRPLDDYLFNSDLTEGTSAADEGDDGPASGHNRYPSYSSLGRTHGAYRLAGVPTERSGSSRDHRGSWGGAGTLRDRGVKERLDTARQSSEFIYMNVIPNENSASRILFNFTALWNNSKTRAAVRQLLQQVFIGVIRGSIALNVPSLVRLWMLVEPVENGDVSASRPKSDALRRYEEEISGPVRMFSPGGDALIDYMDMKRQAGTDMTTEHAERDPKNDVGDGNSEQRSAEFTGNDYLESSGSPTYVDGNDSYSSDCGALYDVLLQGPSTPVVVGRKYLLIALMCTHSAILLTTCSVVVAILCLFVYN